MPEPKPTALARPLLAPVVPPTPAPLERTANAPAIMAADSPASDPPAPEFGVDIGGAANFDGLRALWNSTKGGNTLLLEGLHPVVAVRENSKTKAPELRLLVGPLANVEAAARLCAALSAARRYCQPVGFEGQRLADADIQPAAPKPAAAAPKPKPSPAAAPTTPTAPLAPIDPRLFR
jgi:hypothetical protein